MQLIDLLVAWLISAVGCIVIGVVGFRFGLFGWVLRQRWVYTPLLKLVASDRVTSLGLNLLNGFREAQAADRPDTFRICHSRKAAKITFMDPPGDDHAVKRTIWVPYDSRQVSKMLNHRVVLALGKELVDVTQHVGVPYLVTPRQLGGDYASVISTETGEAVRVIGIDDVIRI